MMCQKINFFQVLTRVLNIIPIAKPTFKGTKKLIKIFKIAGKKQVILTHGTKIMLNLDEVTKFEKEAKNIRKIPKPEGKEIFMGTIDVGGKEVTISVRNYSSKLSGNK